MATSLAVEAGVEAGVRAAVVVALPAGVLGGVGDVLAVKVGLVETRQHEQHRKLARQ